jgi:hypothetical protein
VEEVAPPTPEPPRDLTPREPEAPAPKTRAQTWREKLDKAMADARAAQNSGTDAGAPKDEDEKGGK